VDFFFRTLCFTELKAEMLPTANQPSTSRRVKSETNGVAGADRSTSSSKRVKEIKKKHLFL